MSASLKPPETLYPLSEASAPADAEGLTDHDLRMLADTQFEDQWMTFADGETFTHQVQQLVLPDRLHRRLRTEATIGDEAGRVCLVNLLGYTESIRGGIIRETHAGLAMLNPHLDVSTEATYGIDGSTRAPHRFGKPLTLEEMAVGTQAMLEYAYQDKPIVLAVTSMSAGIAARLIRLNAESDNPVNLIGGITYEGCLTTPENSGLGMAIDFGRHMRKDYKRVRKQIPLTQRPEFMWKVVRSFPLLADLPAVAQQGISLLGGTEERDQEGLDAIHPYDIRGSLDCLTRRRLAGLNGAIIDEIEGAGHAMGAMAQERAASVTRGIRALGIMPQLTSSL